GVCATGERKTIASASSGSSSSMALRSRISCQAARVCWTAGERCFGCISELPDRTRDSGRQMPATICNQLHNLAICQAQCNCPVQPARVSLSALLVPALLLGLLVVTHQAALLVHLAFGQFVLVV